MKTLISLMVLIVAFPCYGSMESGGTGGTAYDQSLNTTDDVEFNSVDTGSVTMSGSNSVGALVDWGCDALTGGASGALDALAVADLSDNDFAKVATGTQASYYYLFDASATQAEDSPNSIRPDDYSTSGVWELQFYISDGTLQLASIDMGGGILEIPNTSSGDQTLTIGQIGLKADEDLLVTHGGAAGEVQDEAGVSLINKLVVRFDPEYEYDTVTENLIDLILLGDAEPHGITITQWNVDYINGDPTTEIDLDLVCDSGGDWNDDAGTTVMDVLDTTAGTASADTGFDSSTCGNGSSVYLRFGADPVDSGEVVRFVLQYYLNED